MKYNPIAFGRLPNEKKARIVCEELSLATHNGTTKEDLLMLLDWCFHEMYMCDNPCYGHKNRRYGLKLIKAGEQNG